MSDLPQAGVPAELDVCEGAYHGFEVAKRAGVTKRANDNLCSWFQHALQHYTAPQDG